VPDVRDACRLDDTSEEARAVQLECYRRMTPAEKYALVLRLGRLARDVALAGLRQRHPNADEQQLRLRLFALEHGAELARQAYGWSADD
jgi:hypothetical protein